MSYMMVPAPVGVLSDSSGTIKVMVVRLNVADWSNKTTKDGKTERERCARKLASKCVRGSSRFFRCGRDVKQKCVKGSFSS